MFNPSFKSFLMASGIPDFSDANLLSRVKCVEDNALKGLLGTISESSSIIRILFIGTDALS